MTAADPRDGLRNDFLHGIVADEVASALLAIGIEAVPEGYLETIASEIVRRYMGGNALAHARPEAVDEFEAVGYAIKGGAEFYTEDHGTVSHKPPNGTILYVRTITPERAP